MNPSILSVGLALAGLMAPFATAAEVATAPRVVIDVRSLGAAGDGVTDDTAVFQAAVDRAAAQRGVVEVPAGRYLVGSIRLPSHVAVVGTGEGSVLQLRPQPLPAANGRAGRSPFDPGHLFLPKDMATVAAVEDVEIRDLVLLGDSARQNGGGPMPLSGAIHGIAILGGHGWVVRNVRAEDFDGDGIYLGGNLLYPGAHDGGNGKVRWPGGKAPESQPMAVGNLIEGNVVRGNLRNGMMIAHGDGNVLRGNLFERNQIGVVCAPRPGPDKLCADPQRFPKYKPGVYESAELDLEPNRIRATAGQPVIWQQVTRTLIEGNTFRDGPRLAIQIVKGAADISDNRIVGNRFVDNLGGGIIVFAEGAQNNVFEDNDFTWTAAADQKFVLRFHAGAGNRVVGNRFHGPLPSSGRLIQFEATSLLQSTRCTEFSDNVIDVPVDGDRAVVDFARNLVDSRVSGNRFVAGGRIDVAPAKLLDDGDQAACRPPMRAN